MLEPAIVTRISYVISMAFFTKRAFAWMTTVLTKTVQLWASEVAVEDWTLMLMAVQVETKTQMLTLVTHKMSFSTLSVMGTQLALVTETEVVSHFITETTHQAFVVLETQRVTFYKDLQSPLRTTSALPSVINPRSLTLEFDM